MTELAMCYICGNGIHNECRFAEDCDCVCRENLKSDACDFGDHGDCWGERCHCSCHVERPSGKTFAKVERQKLIRSGAISKSLLLDEGLSEAAINRTTEP